MGLFSTLDTSGPETQRVQKILANPARPAVPHLEAEIDRLVYELYGLTEEEIALVEGKPNKSPHRIKYAF